MQNETETVNKIKLVGKKEFELVEVDENGWLMTDSLKVADVFGKRHSNVLQCLDNLECSEDFRKMNFHFANYLDRQGKPRHFYKITKDGVVLLAMGFTGKKAVKFKERYIAAFNAMEKALVERQAFTKTGIDIDTLAKVIAASSRHTLKIVDKMMERQEKRFTALIDRAVAPQKTNEYVSDLNGQDNEDIYKILKGLDFHHDHFGTIANKREKRKIKKQIQQVQPVPMKATYYTTRSQIDFIQDHFTRMKCGRLPLPLVGKNLKRLSVEMGLPPNAVGEQNEHIGAYHENVIQRFMEIVTKKYDTLLSNNLGSYLKSVPSKSSTDHRKNLMVV